MPKIRGCGSRPDRQVGSCQYAGRSDEGLGRISARSVGQSDGDVRLGTSPPVRSLPTCYRVCVSGKGAKATSTLSGTDACCKLSLNDQPARGDKNGHIERSSSKTLGLYLGCPKRRTVKSPGLAGRAVKIEPFEGSRWRLRRMRSGYGNSIDFRLQ